MSRPPYTRERSFIVVSSLLVVTTFLSAVPIVCAQSKRATEGKTIRVASISFVPAKFDLTGNADKLEKAFREAASGGAQLAVAPEGALDGYVVNEIIAGQEKPQRMREVAIPSDGPVIQRFRQLAKELEICLVFGFAELVGDDVYNCAVFIDHEGRICGKYHKMQLAEGYHPDWWFNRLGTSCRAWDTPLGRCAILICNDRWNAQLAKIAHLDGAQMLVIPAFGSRSKSQDATVLSRGLEMGVPVVEANVGVSLVVDQGRIVAVQRKDVGIAYANITIPPPILRDITARDDAQREFLTWRNAEMRRRYEKTVHKKRASRE